MERIHTRFQSIGRFAIVLISLAAPVRAATAGQKVLYAFKGGADGMYSQSGLIFDASGNLYGTTTGGGAAGAGTVFVLTPTSNGWNETVLYSFQGGVDGHGPNTTLVMDGLGNLYGTTLNGGMGSCSEGCGTVFELMPPTNGGSWTESILYSFQGSTDGAYPAGVILGGLGNLYGTAGGGGYSPECGVGCGTVFEISPTLGSWTESTLYSFQGAPEDGAGPQSGLTMDSNGNLYGATIGGGAGYGTVYELSPFNGNWSEQIVYKFPGYTRGFEPNSTLVFSSQGALFGTAQGGNPNRCCGIVFTLQPSAEGWTESTAYKFTANNGGASTATLVFDASGNLYGTYNRSGLYQSGTAYLLKQGTGGHMGEAYYSFCPKPGCRSGSDPWGGLILDSSGNLYGTTYDGGRGFGVVYEITP